MRSILLIAVSVALASCSHDWIKPGEGQARLDRDTAYCNGLLHAGQGPAAPNALAPPTIRTFPRDGISDLSLDPAMDQCLEDQGWRKAN